ncbi:leucine-rich repeat domain-containing protein [Ascidiimonas aurantiaca]|uniref:leucine-rich repeat domain-containing protein n=1 Tax=Ascidiimonas aurantiaca TaxID=1685432 RepID=UPI0030EE1DC7
MKKTNLLTAVFFLFLTIVSCSNDDDEVIKSSEKAITAFTFLAGDNEALSENVTATIDQEENTITTQVPFGTNVTALTPSITLSEKAIVDPESKTAADFSDMVEYTVTAEDGTTQKYTVTLTIQKFDTKQIRSFAFLDVDNDSLAEDFTAVIDEENRTITAELPMTADLTALQPAIEVSERATISPEAAITDFTNPVTYTVTAEDESTAEYVVTITRKLSEREVLIALYNANPNSLLRWDLTEEDISQWDGVTVIDGKVTELVLNNKNIVVIPESIKYLTDLTQLNFFVNLITEVPDEIGNLTNLRRLVLGNNQISEIPTTIGQLNQLEYFSLERNGLQALPQEIENLTNLENFYLTNNNLSAIPEEIFELTNLEELFMANNQITEVPAGIRNLTQLRQLRLDNNQINNVPVEIGNLSLLSTLHLNGNNLTSVPVEIAQLTALFRLWLQDNNQLTSIPQAICDMDIDVFQKDETAVCE